MKAATSVNISRCNLKKQRIKVILTWCNAEDVRADATEHVGNSLADGTGECLLLEGRQLVGDNAVHLGKVAEVGTIQDRC